CTHNAARNNHQPGRRQSWGRAGASGAHATRRRRVPLAHAVGASIQVFFEETARLRMPQLADGTLLDLPHALACDLELAAHLFERMVMVVHQAETQLDDFALTLRQVAQDAVDLFTQQAAVRRLDRALLALVLDDVG